MKNRFLLAVTCIAAPLAALLFAAASVQAMMVAPPAPAIRAAMAHTIIVGKVESIEEKTVMAKPYPTSTDKVEYQIAVIKIEDPILVAKGLTHIRVGFIPRPMTRPGVITKFRGVTFDKDQNVLVFLQPHDDGNFMIVQGFNDCVNKANNQNFEKDVTEAKKFVKMLAEPKESLKAEKPEDRYTAAAMLITRYRSARPGSPAPKTEAVDAEISKLILTALAEADWKGPGGPGMMRMNPQQIFMQLQVTDKDGFTPPMMEVKGQKDKQIDYSKYADYAKQWCKDNADKYKIQRLVYEENKDMNDK